MELYITAFLILALFVILGSGVWIGLALAGVAWIGMALFTNRPVGDSMVITIWGSASSWTLTALPLFIWMGEILFRTKLSENMFKGLAPWLDRLPPNFAVTRAGREVALAALVRLAREDVSAAQTRLLRIQDHVRRLGLASEFMRLLINRREVETVDIRGGYYGLGGVCRNRRALQIQHWLESVLALALKRQRARNDAARARRAAHRARMAARRDSPPPA